LNKNVFICNIIKYHIVMKKLLFSSAAFLMLIGFGLKAQTPLNTAVDFTALDSKGVSHTLFSYLDDNKYVVIMFAMTN